MTTAIIYNHSLEKMFGTYASQIADELKKRGETPLLMTNFEAGNLSDSEINFDNSVFLDKDILCGLHLEKKGIRLFNSIGAIEICDDKRRTYEMLEGIIPMPQTVFMPLTFNYTDEFISDFTDKIISSISLPLIAKNPFSSLGWGVFLLKNKDEVINFINENKGAPLLFSKFIEESKGRDVRVYVVGEKVVAAMLRENKNDFRSNIAVGGVGCPYELDTEAKELCIDTARALGLDFCGIDILFSEGKPSLVCEVNSNAMFNEINKVCGVNVAAEIAEHIIAETEKPKEFDPFSFLMI